MPAELLTETYNDLILLPNQSKVFFLKVSLLDKTHTGKKITENLRHRKVSLLRDSPSMGREHFTASSGMCKKKQAKYGNWTSGCMGFGNKSHTSELQYSVFLGKLKIENFSSSFSLALLL